jgi:hypothetical protein
MQDGGFGARPRAGGVNSRRLTRWQLRDIDRAANQWRACCWGSCCAGARRGPLSLVSGEAAAAGAGAVWAAADIRCGWRGEGASSAMPAQLSKRKQRSAARLEVFQRQAAAAAAAATAAAAAAAAAAAVAAERSRRRRRRRRLGEGACWVAAGSSGLAGEAEGGLRGAGLSVEARVSGRVAVREVLGGCGYSDSGGGAAPPVIRR